VAVRVSADDARDAFEAFDRRWAERQGVFERRTVHRELEPVVMPGQDDRALEVARRRSVPESVQSVVRTTRDHPRCRTQCGDGNGARSSLQLSTKAARPFAYQACSAFLDSSGICAGGVTVYPRSVRTLAASV
jgi:hypothetical protein